MEKNKYYGLILKSKKYSNPRLAESYELIQYSINEIMKAGLCSKRKDYLGRETFADALKVILLYPNVPIIVRYDGKNYYDIITGLEINLNDLFIKLRVLPLSNFDDYESHQLTAENDYYLYLENIYRLIDELAIYRTINDVDKVIPSSSGQETNCYTIGFVPSKQNKNNKDVIERISYFKEKMSINDKVFISSRGNLSCDCFDGLYNTVPIVVTVDGDKCYEYWTKTELPIDGIFQINAPISSEELNDLKPGVSNYTYSEAVREFVTILSDYKKDYEQPAGTLGIARTRKSINQKNQGK